MGPRLEMVWPVTACVGAMITRRCPLSVVASSANRVSAEFKYDSHC
jgi:hypothetical protein